MSSDSCPQTEVLNKSALRYRAVRKAVVAVTVVIALASIGYWAVNISKHRAFEHECKSASEAKDWDRLRDAADRWVCWSPTSAKGWWYAAEAAQELEDFEDLADCLGKVPESDLKAILAYAEKANLEWTVLNRPLEALRTSEHVLDIDPRVLEIHSRVISYYAMTMQREQLLKSIRRAIAAGAEPKETYTYLMMADFLAFQNGDTINSHWLAASPNEVRFKIGLAIQTAVKVTMNQESRRTEESVQLNKEASQQLEWFLENQPGDPVLLAYMLHRAYLAGDLEGTAKLLLQVDDRSINDHMIWVYRAWYHTMMDEFEDAEESIHEAIRQHPMSPLAHHEYANLLRRLQRPEVADQQRIAAYGKQLRADIMRIDSAANLTPELLLRIHSYAEACGDVQVATSSQKRL